MSHEPAPRTPPPEPSDAEAIAAVRDGDRSAFATLVRRHNQVMFRACRAVLHDDAEAEDAVQTAWVSAFRALGSFRGEASFRTWITRISVHEASARLRKRRRLAVVSFEETQEVPSMTATVDPAREVHAEELGRLLERQIDALPEGMRVVLVLRDVIELDTAETAACLGIAEEAVRVRLHRARQALSRSEELGRASGEVWRFDGERCARMTERVMAEI